MTVITHYTPCMNHQTFAINIYIVFTTNYTEFRDLKAQIILWNIRALDYTMNYTYYSSCIKVKG